MHLLKHNSTLKSSIYSSAVGYLRLGSNTLKPRIRPRLHSILHDVGPRCLKSEDSEVFQKLNTRGVYQIYGAHKKTKIMSAFATCQVFGTLHSIPQMDLRHI